MRRAINRRAAPEERDAPNYMFVDWLVEEGYSLHHPPKALGQTCLNAFYHKALTTAAELYRIMGDCRSADICATRAEAVEKTGLFARYGMDLLSLWRPIVDECGKGLKEGWFAPEEGYSFDHSHAWGGTPAYQLPCRLLGFRMLEPGFRRIELSPNLYGLAWAYVTMPTPYGMIRCRMQAGMEPEIEVPGEIAWRRG